MSVSESVPVAGDPLASLRDGPLGHFLTDTPCLADAAELSVAEASQATVLALRRLQDIADHRGALQSWFRGVREGGHLLLVVPHAFLRDRLLAMPSADPARRRLYTPAALMEEVEEALPPNSYRVRHLSDADRGYDYAAPSPSGESDVLLALEKIAPPAWALEPDFEVCAPAPDYAFEPSRTRVERSVRPSVRRILLLKLDHMGDFIMGTPALERARALFPDAHITLVVGAWNLDAARGLGVADRVIAFDAFPRNSSEEEVDVHARAALFKEAVTDAFDLAVDMRTDKDTRFLLRHARATLRAGMGTAAQFPFLDVFLPLDFNRNRPETAREYSLSPHDFASQGPVERRDHRLVSHADRAERHCAIIWGPYMALRPGRYVFEPFIEMDPHAEGALLLDIGVDADRVAHRLAPPADRLRLPFRVDRPDAAFEFRIWTVPDMAPVDFSFYGGRLIREGAGSTLHQSEYGMLLIELIAMRLARTGLLAEAKP